MECQTELFEVVGAAHPPGGFPGGLDGGKEESDEDADDRDDDEEFDECEGLAVRWRQEFLFGEYSGGGRGRVWATETHSTHKIT